jgi:acyl dehydratase
MTPDYHQQLELDCGPVVAIDLALFAAASGDHNPLHVDAQVALSAGFDRPVVHGMLSMALSGRLFTQQFGAGSVRHLHTRFTGVAKLGDTLKLTANLQEADGEAATYALKVCNDKGFELVTGSARVQTRAAAT